MELILALLVAGPAGYLTATRRLGIVIYLAAWAVVFPIQTLVVYSMGESDSDALYWIFNALILTGGLTLNQLGSVLRKRRHRPAAPRRAAAIESENL
jgi:hypothetical protein